MSLESSNSHFDRMMVANDRKEHMVTSVLRQLENENVHLLQKQEHTSCVTFITGFL